MKTRRFFYLLGAIMLAALTAMAQKGEKKEMKQEIKRYVQEKVWPVVKADRLAFDAKLSASEKQMVASTRAQLLSHKEEAKATLKSLHEAKKSGQPLSDAQKAQAQQLRERGKVIRQQLQPVVEAHKEDLKGLHESAKQWMEDIKAIMEKHGFKHEGKKHGRPDGGAHEGKKPGGPNGDGKKPHGKMMGALKMLTPEGFLLLDPNMNVLEEGEDEMESEEPQSFLYPNPAKGDCILEFETPSAGNVRIDVLDKDGKLVKTLFQGEKGQGIHSLKVNMDDLPANMYFYRISGDKFSSTQRFVVEK